MRLHPSAAALTVAVCSAGCALLPPPADAPKARVSPDYVASGDWSGVRAFVYGKRTVLELDGRPLHLSVRDENGVAVRIERQGRYYRLERQLTNFSVWVNLRAMTFAAAPTAARAPAIARPTPAAIAPPTLTAAPPRRAEAPTQASEPGDGEARELLQLSAAQLDEVRQAIAGSASQAEAKALQARLDRIEAQIVAAATALVRVEFDTAQTAFRPPDQVARVLIPAAKAAERINVRGRTDARVPGSADPGIALHRALSARQYLVERGVDASKIRVFSLPAGDFVAPAGSPEGRALNRRVDIELVNRRFARLHRDATALAEAAQ